jgi:hypothetical protein
MWMIVVVVATVIMVVAVIGNEGHKIERMEEAGKKGQKCEKFDGRAEGWTERRKDGPRRTCACICELATLFFAPKFLLIFCIWSWWE